MPKTASWGIYSKSGIVSSWHMRHSIALNRRQRRLASEDLCCARKVVESGIQQEIRMLHEVLSNGERTEN